MLGDHIGQMGSLVQPERLRFDFSHFSAMTPEQIEEVEKTVNDKVRQDLPVETGEEDLERAKEMGARALFGEKYDQRVRFVRIGDYSLELCGGTHVSSTGQIGHFDLLTESGIAAGTRRAEALTGEGAEEAVRRRRGTLERLGAGADRLGDRCGSLSPTEAPPPQLAIRTAVRALGGTDSP